MPESNAFLQPGLTLPDVLARVVRNYPDRIIGYSDKNGNIITQTYQELYSEARNIAAGMSVLGLKKGDKVILATQTNRETVELLWGCFLMGVVPTILQPPMTFSGYNPSVVKLVNVFEELGRPFVFMSQGIKDTGDFPSEKIIHKGDLDFQGKFPEILLDPNDLAFIQFSSGSTGEPRGVMLTHRNLMVNMDAIRNGTVCSLNDSWGNWMPFFHDMGLIGYHLTPIFSQVSQFHVETLDFIMNPGLWLTMLSGQKVSISGCTNFALALVLKYLKRGKQLFDWDFSSLKALLNGAEPISVATMEEFVAALAPYNFKPETMMPVYGMAESTLAISFAALTERSVSMAFDASLLDRENKARPVDPSLPSARMISEVGVALNNIEIRIVDNNDQPLQEGNAGHIQIKGPSVTRGYYNNPEATASAFCGDWLRTGDIGFFFDGRLFISGRFKDIIFKNGRHYFANDLEDIACTIADINFGKVCFGGTTSRETGQDKVIAFLAGVSEQKAMDTFRELRSLLRNTLGMNIDELVLIKSNEMPKTSSGKLQRYKLMLRYRNGELNDKIITADKLENH